MQNKDDKAANMIVVNSQDSVESAENLISTAIIKNAERQQAGSMQDLWGWRSYLVVTEADKIVLVT